MKRLVLSLALAAAFGLSATAQIPDHRVSFVALTAVGNTPAANMTGAPAPVTNTTNTPYYTVGFFPLFHTVQAGVTGAPTSCIYHVWGTTKLPSENPVFPTDYQDLSGALDCTTAAGSMVHIYYKPIAEVVIALSTLSGGTSPAVQFNFISSH